jgi:putative transposase
MANSYTQLYYQFILVTKFRNALIKPEWENELYKYITGIVQGKKHKLFCINGMPDHVHFFIGMNPAESISDLMQELKACSSKWINEKKLCPGRFEWQKGYAAFTYSKSQTDRVVNYINNQKIHHQKKSFISEYKEFLEKFEVEYDERYIFQEPE